MPLCMDHCEHTGPRVATRLQSPHRSAVRGSLRLAFFPFSFVCLLLLWPFPSARSAAVTMMSRLASSARRAAVVAARSVATKAVRSAVAPRIQQRRALSTGEKPAAAAEAPFERRLFLQRPVACAVRACAAIVCWCVRCTHPCGCVLCVCAMCDCAPCASAPLTRRCARRPPALRPAASSAVQLPASISLPSTSLPMLTSRRSVW